MEFGNIIDERARLAQSHVLEHNLLLLAPRRWMSSMSLKMNLCSLIYKNLVEKNPNCLFGATSKWLQMYDYT